MNPALFLLLVFVFYIVSLAILAVLSDEVCTPTSDEEIEKSLDAVNKANEKAAIAFCKAIEKKYE